MEERPVTIERSVDFTFTKLVVDDLDAMAEFYCSVFDLHNVARANFDQGDAGSAIEEIVLATTPDAQWGSFVLMKFKDRPPTKEVGAIVGFTTTDLPALLDRVRRFGGSVIGDIKNMSEHGFRVALVRDPEGHLNELVEMVG